MGTSRVAAEKKKLKDRQDGLVRSTPGKDLAMVASKGSTSKGVQGQLVGQALAVSQTKAEEKKKISSSSSKLGAALAKIPTKEVNQKRKKKKKRTKRRRKKKGGDPGGGGGGDDSSSSPSSSGETENSEAGSSKSGHSRSSDEELEAPLRKKSKKNPGSVLELLIPCPRAIGSKRSRGCTCGKRRRPLSDFGYQGDDLLPGVAEAKARRVSSTSARNAPLGNASSSRKIRSVRRHGASSVPCLHQSILDGNWSAARHLELFPMEEVSAASTALMLKTRKHARLAARAQGVDGGGGYWSGYGRGAKGKGKQDWQGGNVKDGKGKGKKGGKGKGKKSKQNWWQDSEKGTDQEWKDSKESKGDK